MARIALIGNVAGGKTTLARRLATFHASPLHFVDRIQYGPGWAALETDAVTRALDAIAATDDWIIDGWGPWPSIEQRFRRADTIIWIDHPLWVHFWWAAERQVSVARGDAAPRSDGPEDTEPLAHTRRLFEAIWGVDQLKPRLAALIDRYRDGRDVRHITSPEELDAFAAGLT